MPNTNVNKPDDKGWTPLMITARHGNTNQVQSLLRQGADPHWHNQAGLTALHYAHANPSKEYNLALPTG